MTLSGPRFVTLTFDNGPCPGVTDGVLDTLARRGLKTTFFVVGANLRSRDGRALAERAQAEGHWIGNHTLTHSVPLGELEDAAVDREIDEAQALIADLAHSDRLFRPYGAGGVIDRRLLGRHGRQRLLDGAYTCSLWNNVPGDWLDRSGWVDVCVATATEQTWSVIVVHDVATGAMGHLQRLIDRLDALDVEWRQDLPDACTPIRRGQPTSSYGLIEV